MRLYVLTAHEHGTDFRDQIVCASTISADDAMKTFLTTQRTFWEAEAEGLMSSDRTDALEIAAQYDDAETFQAMLGEEWEVTHHECEIEA